MRVESGEWSEEGCIGGSLFLSILSQSRPPFSLPQASYWDCIRRIPPWYLTMSLSLRGLPKRRASWKTRPFPSPLLPLIQDPRPNNLRAMVLSQVGYCRHYDLQLPRYSRQTPNTPSSSWTGPRRRDLEKLKAPAVRCDVDIVPPMPRPRCRVGAMEGRLYLFWELDEAFSALPTKANVTTQALHPHL